MVLHPSDTETVKSPVRKEKQMEKSADAVVIGGGIMGASTAHFLAKRGFGKVVLLEKQHLAAVSTGSSAANIRSHYSNTLTIRLAMRALDMFGSDREELGGDSGFRRVGMMILMGEHHLDSGLAVLAGEQKLGTGSRRISLDEASELAPQFDLDGVAAAAYQPRGGYADPAKTTRALVDSAAEKWGLAVYEGVPATGIQRDGDRVTAVDTPEGRIETRVVVNAAGPWGRHVGAWAGRNYSVRWSREGDLVLRLPADFGPFPVISDPGSRIYFRPHEDNGLLAGRDYPKEIEPLDIDDYDALLDMNTRSNIEKGLFRRLPELRHAKFDHGWSSIYTITDDWHPLVGAEPGVEGYYACFGGSGHGFKLAPPIGEALADVIAGETPNIDIRELRPGRFADGESFTSAWGSGNRA